MPRKLCTTRLILSLSATLYLSSCAHGPRGVSETCLPVPGQNQFECVTGPKDARVVRKITAEQLQGFGCFPLDDIRAVFQPVEK